VAAAGLAPAFAPQASATTRPAADAPRVHPWLPQGRLVGQGTLRFLGFAVYDAALFAGEGFEPAAPMARPFVLELLYRRALSGEAIAERSLEEMRRQPGLDEATAEQRWLPFMRRAFPDVREGDRLAGAWQPETATSRFALNGGPAVELRDAAFARHFFGIWLAPETSRPELRGQLLGLR
jgi:hypothetical protein